MTTSKHPIVLTTHGSFHHDIVARLERMGAKVHTVHDAKSAAKLYPQCTHVLIPGGADVHPACYNQPVRHARHADSRRDGLELAIVDACLKDRKPLFGICRGHQVITIAAGGTLHQDTWHDAGVAHVHSSHGVKVQRNTPLYRWVGNRVNLIVNSYHHQATDRVPKGWRVAAVSNDGLIEAIAHPKLPVISVQWHPEAMTTQPALALFRHWLAL